MAQPRLTLLDANDRSLLLEQTLVLLESVGVKIESRQARDLLGEADCRVDDETAVVRLPRSLVEDTLSHLSRRVLLAARDPAKDAMLDGRTTFLTTAGICPQVVDRTRGTYREPTLDDLALAGRLADALDEVGIVWFPFSPTADAPGERSDLASLACLLQNTAKHVQGQLVRPRDVPVALEILRLAVPDGDLRERPIFSSLYCPVSPLVHEAEAMEAAMLMAAAKVPLDIFSLALAGATSPMTLAGTVVQTLAEELSAAVVFKLVEPDCPLILSSDSGVLDMRTSRFATSTPETILMNLAEIEMVHFLGAPSLSVGHVSDSFCLGFRAGLEDMAFALPTRLARPDIMIGLGTVEAGQAFSFAKLVLDAEVAQHNDRVLQGMDIDSEHVALDVIAAVGPAGHYLEHEHTCRLLRSGEQWFPDLLARDGYAEQTEGCADELARADARVDEILASHEVKPLPERAMQAIEAVLHERPLP